MRLLAGVVVGVLVAMSLWFVLAARPIGEGAPPPPAAMAPADPRSGDADARLAALEAEVRRLAAEAAALAELHYKPARRASAVRIHEVCVAGAVVQVSLIDESGGRHVVWAGADPTQRPGAFEVRFAPTGYRVRGVHVLLDTNKSPGWSEIDAVELAGPDGSAWAREAKASSAYGQ